ncbi:MAG TPA: hypothetical protein VHV80_15375, partial [Steroidobacteraceae bacterium]|nr:hypothetical protein [Steroidobacteraceae bacterium]
GSVKGISDAPLGDDVPRLRVISLYLAAQAQDLHIDRPVVDFVVVDPAGYPGEGSRRAFPDA